MKLTRRQTLTALGGALATPCVRPSWAQAGTVNVYNWADYIGETTLADFEAETGIKVVYDLYASPRRCRPRCWPDRPAMTWCCRPGVSPAAHGARPASTRSSTRPA